MKTWFVIVLFCAAALSARAASSGRDMAEETKIENEVAAIDPALVAPFRQARIAYDRKDYAESARLLREVVAKAPTSDAAARRLGASLAMAGDQKGGIAWGEKAVALKRSAFNLAGLAYTLAIAPNGDIPRADLVRANKLLGEARALPDGSDTFTWMISEQVALRLEAYDEAGTILAKLRQIAPDEMGTHYYAAVLAAIGEHWNEAEREIHRAVAVGLDPAAARRFLDSGVHSRAMAWRYAGITGGAIGLWAVGLLGLCGVGYGLSWSTLRHIERADPNLAISSGERSMRRLYRAVLNVAGVYYYISLPVVLVMVVAVGGGLIYGFIAAGTIPIKLTVLIGFGVIATVWSMVRSLFIRVSTEDPGRPLTREEAAAVWRVAEEVAATVNTTPVDEIRLTPGTDLAVYERGTWRERRNNRAKRILVLGTAVLNGFKQQEFRSVLAHEYGHFAHRDTAGGDIALRVRRDIWNFYLAMRAAGQATKLNLAFHFLRFYHFIFRRISHGATRLQEVLADRVAARAYGPLAFQGGLTHAVRRGIEFDAYADTEIKAALNDKRPLQNLYEGAPSVSESVEEAVQKALARPTTPDDTHPSPQDRFRLVAPIPAPAAEAASGMVWDLFKDPDAIRNEMTAEVEKRIAAHRK